MKRLNMKKPVVLASFVIVAILTACPAADSGGGSKGGSVTGPSFQNLGIDVAEKKIIVFFNTEISGTPDASKISLKKGSATLTPTTDYTLAIEQGRLVIKLMVAPKESEQYTVELQGGAVKDAKGKDSTANTSSDKKTLTVGIIPDIAEPLAFQANSDTVLTLAFNTNIEIVDKAKIKLEVQAGGTGGFTAARATSMVNAKTRLELTLSTAATQGNVYKVTVGAGAIKATESNLVNAGALSSSQTTYSTRPILRTDPYILDNKLVAPFNLSIEIRDPTKVKVYKDPAGGNEEINLNQADIAVNSKNLLEITLPAVTAGEVYRLRLDAGAVSEEGKAANANEAITPEDITIGAAPALHTETDPSLGRQKIIVTFDAPIRILDKTKIKYQLDSATITPTTTPTVENNNQLEIPLNDALVDGHVYRIHLEAGALGGGKNTVSMGSIQPKDKDITAVAPTLTDVQPAFDSATQLSVTFPVDVAIVGDGSTINVQKKDDGDSFTTLTAASRDIAVDGTEAKKINIILTGSEKITPYIQVWKVEFPANTVKTATSQIPNAGPLTTLESEKPKLTDLYSWEEVTKASGSNKWKAREGHTSVVFDPDGAGERIWVLGGYHGSSRLNDVWSSTDGEIWTESTPPGSAEKDTDGGDGAAANWWTARTGHTSVVFDSKIWVMGGTDGSARNDVWSSADGETWTQVDAAADWKARIEHTSVAFAPDGKGERIWVMGGTSSGLDRFNDVWSSADGETWTQVDAAADWKARIEHTSVVFPSDGAGKKIWVMGGWDVVFKRINDVWSSDNGQTWGKGTGLPHSVYSASTVEYKGRLWSLGGSSRNSTTKVFLSSADPATGWTAENTLPEAILATQAVVFKNRIWLLGGNYGGAETNTVWKMGPGTE